MKKWEKQKENNGITLIALIVTIIILIILATISIGAIFGEKGIIKQAKMAKLETEQSKVLEDTRMELYAKEIADIKNTGAIKNNIDYLKEKGYIKNENQIDGNTYYTVDSEKIIENASSGLGNMEKGDNYYILDGELYYIDQKKEIKKLGYLFEEENPIVEFPWIWHVDEDGNAVITGMELENYIFESRNDFKYWNVTVHLGVKKLIIPSYIEGHKVVSIEWRDILEMNGGYYTTSCIEDVEVIELPSTLEKFEIIGDNGWGYYRGFGFSGVKSVIGNELLNDEVFREWGSSDSK